MDVKGEVLLQTLTNFLTKAS